MPACAETDESTGVACTRGPDTKSPASTSRLSRIQALLAISMSALGGIATAQTIHAWNNLQNTVLERTPFTSMWDSDFFSWFNHPVALFLTIPMFLSYFMGLSKKQISPKFSFVGIAIYFACSICLYHNPQWSFDPGSYPTLVCIGGMLMAIPMFLLGKSIGKSLERGGFRTFFACAGIGFIQAILFIWPAWFLKSFELTLLTCFLIPLLSGTFVAWTYGVKSFKTACALGLTAVVPFLSSLIVYACIGLIMMAENHFNGYQNIFLNATRLLGPAFLIFFLGPLGGFMAALVRLKGEKTPPDPEDLLVVRLARGISGSQRP